MRLLFNKTNLKVEDIITDEVEQRESVYYTALENLESDRCLTLEEYLMNCYQYEFCTVPLSGHHRPEYYIDALNECVKVGLVKLNMCFGIAFADKYKELKKFTVDDDGVKLEKKISMMQF